MTIKILSSVGWSGVDAGSTYEIISTYEGFLFFYDEFGRLNGIHERYEGRSYEVVG